MRRVTSQFPFYLQKSLKDCQLLCKKNLFSSLKDRIAKLAKQYQTTALHISGVPKEQIVQASYKKVFVWLCFVKNMRFFFGHQEKFYWAEERFFLTPDKFFVNL